MINDYKDKTKYNFENTQQIEYKYEPGLCEMAFNNANKLKEEEIFTCIEKEL